MMAVPSRDLGDPLVTNWAETALFFPKMDQPLFSFEGVYHLHVQAFFIVVFPLRIVRIGLSTDLGVSFNWHMGGICKIMRLFFSVSVEHPIVSSDGFEVFLRNPFIGFSWMSSFYPLSHRMIDCIVYHFERFFAHYMLMIGRPSPDDGVELHNQVSCAERAVSLQDVPYLF